MCGMQGSLSKAAIHESETNPLPLSVHSTMYKADSQENITYNVIRVVARTRIFRAGLFFILARLRTKEGREGKEGGYACELGEASILRCVTVARERERERELPNLKLVGIQ